MSAIPPINANIGLSLLIILQKSSFDALKLILLALLPNMQHGLFVLAPLYNVQSYIAQKRVINEYRTEARADLDRGGGLPTYVRTMQQCAELESDLERKFITDNDQSAYTVPVKFHIRYFSAYVTRSSVDNIRLRDPTRRLKKKRFVDCDVDFDTTRTPYQSIHIGNYREYATAADLLYTFNPRQFDYVVKDSLDPRQKSITLWFKP